MTDPPARHTPTPPLSARAAAKPGHRRRRRRAQRTFSDSSAAFLVARHASTPACTAGHSAAVGISSLASTAYMTTRSRYCTPRSGGCTLPPLLAAAGLVAVVVVLLLRDWRR